MFSAPRLFSAAFLAAAVLMSTGCAAQTYYRYPVASPRVVVDDRAYSRGFDEGRGRGENDARKNRAFDYSRYGEYRSADQGYHGYGDRDAYRSLYRQGFVAGYNDGYRRFARDRYPSTVPPYADGRYGSAPPPYADGRYGSPASQVGYRDGYQQGLDDARDHDRYDPIRASRYRSADHEYNSRYGSRDVYQREYRAAFQSGYDQGYRGYRR